MSVSGIWSLISSAFACEKPKRSSRLANTVRPAALHAAIDDARVMLASFLCLRGAALVLLSRGPIVRRGLPARGMPGIDVVVCVGDLRDGDLHVVMGGNVREARAECDRGRLCVSGMFMRLVLLSPHTLRAGWCAERVGASVSSRARALRHSMLHLSGIWRLLDTRARHSERKWRCLPSASRARPDRRSEREGSSKCWVGDRRSGYAVSFGEGGEANGMANVRV